MVAPLICYELKEEDCFVALTPQSSLVFSTIANYSGPLFANEQQFKRYVINNLQADGTEIFITHLRNPNQSALNGNQKKQKLVPDSSGIETPSPICYELTCNAESSDIVVSQDYIKYQGLSDSLQFEYSLARQTNFLYIQHPPEFKLQINNHLHEPRNPYDQLYRAQANTFSGGSAHGFKWRICQNQLEGILVYRYNTLVRRLLVEEESVLGRRDSHRNLVQEGPSGIVVVPKGLCATTLQKNVSLICLLISLGLCGQVVGPLNQGNSA